MRDTVQPGVSAPALLLTTDKITVSHHSRDAYVYVFSELWGLPNYVVYQCISGGL